MLDTRYGFTLPTWYVWRIHSAGAWMEVSPRNSRFRDSIREVIIHNEGMTPLRRAAKPYGSPRMQHTVAQGWWWVAKDGADRQGSRERSTSIDTTHVDRFTLTLHGLLRLRLAPLDSWSDGCPWHSWVLGLPSPTALQMAC